jgi:tRNA G10  N-methylase Trm11
VQTWCARVRRFENGKFGRALRSPLQSEERADVGVFEELLEKLPGPVRLLKPQHTLFILSGPFLSSSKQTSADTEQQQHSTDTAETAQRVLLTRQLCEGFNPTPYALPTRRFLSTTTMEHEAAFVMANQAQITSGMSVLDPYAGSGGLLLTAAVVGAAVTVGIEMDKRLRYAQLNSNFEQQQLSPLTALIHGDSATAAVQEQALQANGGRPFDVIITDPPYGKYHNAACMTDSCYL